MLHGDRTSPFRVSVLIMRKTECDKLFHCIVLFITETQNDEVRYAHVHLTTVLVLYHDDTIISWMAKKYPELGRAGLELVLTR